MRHIVTGGTGLIGRGLTSNLVAAGHEVIILSRNPARAIGSPAGVRVERWDGCTATGWGNLIEGTDAIINLASENIAGDSWFSIRWTKERKKRILDSRINAGKAVSEAIRLARKKPMILIQPSAVGYYGTQNGDTQLTEDSSHGSDYLSQVCQLWESVNQEVEAFGVRRVVLRTGVVLSTQGGSLPRQMLPFKIFVGGPFGRGRQWLSWIHIADVISAIRFLIENENAYGAVNLTSPQPLTNAEFSHVLGRVMNRPDFIPIPDFFFKIIFGEVAMILLEGQRVDPKHLIEMGFQFKFPDVELALRNLLLK
jgi:uncharacterized protein (TIGR01777 family)